MNMVRIMVIAQDRVEVEVAGDDLDITNMQIDVNLFLISLTPN